MQNSKNFSIQIYRAICPINFMNLKVEIVNSIMKITLTTSFILIVSIFIFYTGQHVNQNYPATNTNQQQDLAIKWDDSLFKHLPKGMDTNIIVEDSKRTPLRFFQYIKPVFNHQAIIYQDKGTWRLHSTAKSAYDSLGKDDFAVARIERAAAYRTTDKVKSWSIKLNAIAHTLAQADYVLVLKTKRKMFIQRKGKNILTFDINLGNKPVGNKEFDGDGKTPEGIYYLDLKHFRKDNLYKSFWISYPNENDRQIAKSKGLKTGVGIMIHGTTKANINAKDWTAGCIALKNKDIDLLFDRVASGTPIEIRK